MIQIENLTYRISSHLLIDQASTQIPYGYKVGVVGKNGCGKSTLFQIITQELEPDNGTVNIAGGLTVGIIKQDLPKNFKNLIELVISSNTELFKLQQELETCEDATRLSEIYERLNQLDASTSEAKACSILNGLGFDDNAQQQHISEFSGGWQMRVALASALFNKPDILLLDEPTNHLDFEAIIWLQDFINYYDGTIIMISHDRHFLNETVKHIIHFDNKKLFYYKGNYDQFEETRALKILNQQALFEKQQAQIKHMMDFVNKFRAKATKAKQAQSRLKSIEKINLVDAVIKERSVNFSFPQAEILPPPLYTLDKVSLGYGEKIILRDINLRIDIEDRIVLLGANGNGKSTLIKLLAGKLEPIKGEVNKSNKLRIGYFAQNQTDELDENLTAYQMMVQITENNNQTQVRASLGRFGFDQRRSETLIRELSGGEKVRLLFAILSYHRPHLLLLDEPTNHLDIEAKESLLSAINNFNGAVIIVSHDYQFIERFADQLLLVEDGKVISYEDDLANYQKTVLENKKKINKKIKQEISANANDKLDNNALIIKLEQLENRRKHFESKANMTTKQKTEYEKIIQEINRIEKEILN